jgi:hypothetical protein
MNQVANATRVFELYPDLNRLPSEARTRIHPDAFWHDLWTNPSPYNSEVATANDGWELSDVFDKNGAIQLPKHIVLFGWFDLLPLTELPTNNLIWTIISKRFLEVIKQLGFVDYNLINLRVIDSSQFEDIFGKNPREFEENTALHDLCYDDEMFYGFQVRPRVSLLTEDSEDTNRMGKKVIWRDDVSEVPLFFHESHFPGRLLVNQEARDALEKAGIRGLRFSPAFE